MQAAETQTPTADPGIVMDRGDPKNASIGIDDLRFDIGLWLAGTESFLNNRSPLRIDNAAAERSNEFRLTRSGLMICSELNYRLHRAFTAQKADTTDTKELLLLLRELITLNNGFVKAGQLGFDAWKTWGNIVAEKLEASAAAQKFLEFADRTQTGFLPGKLQGLIDERLTGISEFSDLQLIFPRFGKILRSLAVIGQMLRSDEPLQPCVLIFSRVYEQTRDLIQFMNNRISRLPDETSELFASLDGASYTASIELKKVYHQELTGLVKIRPAPSVYARVETAYSLLNDSFEQILASFALQMEPGVMTTKLLPNLQEKLDQSLELRTQLSELLTNVQNAEQNPETFVISALRKQLDGFLEKTIRYLFFKDRETLERFCEEVAAGSQKQDLVPILHRFGAYLETLLGQVNMRVVLAGHSVNEGLPG